MKAAVANAFSGNICNLTATWIAAIVCILKKRIAAPITVGNKCMNNWINKIYIRY